VPESAKDFRIIEPPPLISCNIGSKYPVLCYLKIQESADQNKMGNRPFGQLPYGLCGDLARF